MKLNEVLVTGTKIIASNELIVPPNHACSNHSAFGGMGTQGGFKQAKKLGKGRRLSFPGVPALWKHKRKRHF